MSQDASGQDQSRRMSQDASGGEKCPLDLLDWRETFWRAFFSSFIFAREALNRRPLARRKAC